MKIYRHLTSHSLSRCGWAGNPDSIVTEFSIAHDSDLIFLQFNVSEPLTVARCTHDLDHVHNDSCVEFFVSPNPLDGIYYNLECNPLGIISFKVGKGRKDRTPAPESVLRSIKRFPSLEFEPFEARNIPVWNLALVIPKEAFFVHDLHSLDGVGMKGNFFKCGDSLPNPHFYSHAPVLTQSPDFHRPEFFEEIDFV